MSKHPPHQSWEKGPADRQFVTALARGLSILRCFNRPNVELTVSEIARNVGLSQPTAWRLCYTLLESGFLVRAPSGGALRIGAPAITLGYAATHGMDEAAVARPYMQRVLDETGGTTTLSLRQGPSMIAMEQINGDFLVRSQPIGWRAPLDTVSSGLAVLATLPHAARSAAVEQLTISDSKRMRICLEHIAEAEASLEQTGIVRLSHMLEGRLMALSVPLFERGSAPGAQWTLTCTGLTSFWSDAAQDQAARLLVEIRQLLTPAFAALPGRTGTAS